MNVLLFTLLCVSLVHSHDIATRKYTVRSSPHALPSMYVLSLSSSPLVREQCTHTSVFQGVDEEHAIAFAKSQVEFYGSFGRKSRCTRSEILGSV